jgi:hypothetical protein
MANTVIEKEINIVKPLRGYPIVKIIIPVYTNDSSALEGDTKLMLKSPKYDEFENELLIVSSYST